MAQYLCQSPGLTFWFLMKTRQLYQASSHKRILQEPQPIKSLLLVVDSRRKTQSSVSTRTSTSERLKVSMKRRTLVWFYAVYTQMQNSLSCHAKTQMFFSFHFHTSTKWAVCSLDKYNKQLFFKIVSQCLKLKSRDQSYHGFYDNFQIIPFAVF